MRLIVPALLALGCASCRQGEPAPRPATESAAASAAPSEEAVSSLASGRRLLEQFQHEQAEARFARALELSPGWLPAQVDLAIAQMNQLDEASAARAEASARAAVALGPQDARAHYVLGYVLGERLGRFEEALVPLRAATAAAPDDPGAWLQLGRALEETARSREDAATRAQARDAYERALALDPRSVEATYRLGRLLIDSDAPADKDQATELLGRHERLAAGRPAVQPNYLTRGMLAQAYPFRPERKPPTEPAPVTLTPSVPLVLPPPGTGHLSGGASPSRFREGVAVLDTDGDGMLDVVAPLRDPQRPDLAWWRREGPRTFGAAQPLGAPGAACSTVAAGDIERDGDLDLFVTCSAGNLLLLREPGGYESVTPPDMGAPGVGAARATFVDIDHDGDLDLHALLPIGQRPGAGWTAESLAWRNDGAGRFSQAASIVGLLGPFGADATLWTDFDGDNAVDVVAVLADGGLALLMNQRDAPFVPRPLPMTLPAGAGPPVVRFETLDADGDDDPDLVVLAGGVVTLLVNDSTPGAPAFRSLDLGTPPSPASALAVADLDLDGARELLLLLPDDELGTTRPLLLRAPGVAVPARTIGGKGLEPEVLAPADVDSDGAVDLVVRRAGGEPVVLWTTPPAGSTWMRLELRGREGRSNPQGFGAKLTIDAGTLHVRFESQPGRGALGTVVAPEVVGLGGRSRADGVTTLWPSGIQQGEADLLAGAQHAIVELDRQPSSCPMLYGWDGERFAFLTDCFDTAPAGLWIGEGMHWAGDPFEVLRIRSGWVAEQDGVLNLSIAEFLNETLLADRVGMLAFDHPDGTALVVDEGVRLAAPPQPLVAYAVSGALPVAARQAGRDVSAALRERDGDVAGWTEALPWMGLAKEHALELSLPARDGILVLTGSLNFSNSQNLFAASQAGVRARPARLEVRDGSRWRELTPDCGAPAGFHKDVVIDLRPLALPDAPTLRITTNLQVSWDSAVLWRDVATVPGRELPLLRAEKRWLGVPRETKGPQDRWRSFEREALDGASPWIRQAGPVTPDGDVRAEVREDDDAIAFVRPGEELLLAFDAAALAPPAAERTHVLSTHGWVKDATPHTALAESVLPVPKAGAALYP